MIGMWRKWVRYARVRQSRGALCQLLEPLHQFLAMLYLSLVVGDLIVVGTIGDVMFVAVEFMKSGLVPFDAVLQPSELALETDVQRWSRLVHG